LAKQTAISRGLPGAALIAAALLLAGIHEAVPALTATWLDSVHVLFWGALGVMLLAGLTRLVVALLPEQQRRQLSSLRRHRVLIPKEGLIYLVIMIVLFVGSLLGHENMLMLVFAMLAGPFVINGWAAFAMLKGSQVARAIPRRAMCGELFAVELTLRNTRGWLSLWMMQVQDTVSGCGETLEPTNIFTCVPPGGRQVGHYTLRLRRRGVYEFGPIHLSSRFPLGLIERGQVFPLSDQVMIYPRIGRLTPLAQRQLLGADELTSERRAQSGVFHDEFHHLREYRAGDNPRAIHWRTSARRGSLILREYEQHREQHLSLIVDLWEPAGQVVDDDRERTEWALSLAATVCLEQRRQARDSRLSLYASGKTTAAWEGRATAASLESLFDELAVIQSGPAERTGELLERAWQNGGASTRYLVISTRTSEQDRWRQGVVERLPPAASQKITWMFVDPALMTQWVRFPDE
jgi:uncharacterized protein (DUF58 family)